MITKEKLILYEKYNGDVDHLIRFPRLAKCKISEQEFSTIANLLQDTRLVQRGPASADYIEQANKNIAGFCDSNDTIIYLNHLAATTKL